MTVTPTTCMKVTYTTCTTIMSTSTALTIQTLIRAPALPSTPAKAMNPRTSMGRVADTMLFRMETTSITWYQVICTSPAEITATITVKSPSPSQSFT